MEYEKSPVYYDPILWRNWVKLVENQQTEENYDGPPFYSVVPIFEKNQHKRKRASLIIGHAKVDVRIVDYLPSFLFMFKKRWGSYTVAFFADALKYEDSWLKDSKPPCRITPEIIKILNPKGYKSVYLQNFTMLLSTPAEAIEEMKLIYIRKLIFRNGDPYDCRCENICFLDTLGKNQLYQKKKKKKDGFVIRDDDDDDDDDDVGSKKRKRKKTIEKSAAVKTKKTKKNAREKERGVINRSVTKVSGVYLKKKRFIAEIKKDDKTIHIGTFKKLRDAICTRIDAEKLYFSDASFSSMCQLIELERTIEKVESWLSNRKWRCRKCGSYLIRIDAFHVQKRSIYENLNCGKNLSTDDLNNIEDEEDANVVKENSELDWIVCACGWFKHTIFDIYILGKDNYEMESRICYDLASPLCDDFNSNFCFIKKKEEEQLLSGIEKQSPQSFEKHVEEIKQEIEEEKRKTFILPPAAMKTSSPVEFQDGISSSSSPLLSLFSPLTPSPSFLFITSSPSSSSDDYENRLSTSFEDRVDNYLFEDMNELETSDVELDFQLEKLKHCFKEVENTLECF